MKDFVDSHPDLGVATRAFQSAMETIQSNRKWLESNKASIKAWLEGQEFAF